MNSGKMAFGESAAATIERRRTPKPEGVKLGGVFHVECFDKDGKLKWTDDIRNTITNGALDDILDVAFGNGTQKTVWYIGLIHSTNYGAGPAAGDTAASHSGWEEGTEYSESARQEWQDDAASSQSKTNSTSADFSINATVTMKGLFLISDATKGGSSGTLWTSVLFSAGDQSLGNGDVLKVTYTLTAARA